jgi:hypothetical protein
MPAVSQRAPAAMPLALQFVSTARLRVEGQGEFGYDADFPLRPRQLPR